MTHTEYCRQFLKKEDSVLDVGSGRGNFLVEMAESGFKVFGVETNSDYINASKLLAAEKKVEISIVEGRAEALPFSAASFDFVNCAEVTEHVDDPLETCHEIYRVLKPGGKCYISFHNRFGILDYHYNLYFINWVPRLWTEPILRFFGKQKEDGQTGRHKLITMHYYTYSQVTKILVDAGFLFADIRASKIKQRLGIAALFVLPIYYLILRPFYFNTFHLLLEKK